MSIQTQIICYPETMDKSTFEKLINLFLKGNWIIPTKYGRLSETTKLLNKITEDDINSIYRYYTQYPSLILYGKQKMFIDFYKYDGDLKFSSWINHYTESDNKDFFSKTEYNDQVAEVMSQTKAFYAECQDSKAHHFYNKRLEQRNGYKELVLTVNGIEDGLANPAWKMWFGKKYIEAFGKDKLLHSPCRMVKDYGDYIYINLFDDAESWQTKEALKIVEAFKMAVGYDFFYDPGNIKKKLMTPDFSNV